MFMRTDSALEKSHTPGKKHSRSGNQVINPFLTKLKEN